jgi:hypothetical protein
MSVVFCSAKYRGLVISRSEIRLSLTARCSILRAGTSPGKVAGLAGGLRRNGAERRRGVDGSQIAARFDGILAGWRLTDCGLPWLELWHPGDHSGRGRVHTGEIVCWGCLNGLNRREARRLTEISPANGWRAEPGLRYEVGTVTGGRGCSGQINHLHPSAARISRGNDGPGGHSARSGAVRPGVWIDWRSHSCARFGPAGLLNARSDRSRASAGRPVSRVLDRSDTTDRRLWIAHLSEGRRSAEVVVWRAERAGRWWRDSCLSSEWLECRRGGSRARRQRHQRAAG